MTIQTFAEARTALSAFYSTTSKYKLDTLKSFLAEIDNPQDKMPAVHVAGTSGKTSTAYYAAALLGAAGYRVGLTVSPHVDEINERVQINLQPLPEAEFCLQLSEFLDIVLTSGYILSYFEVMTAFAFWYFAKIGVDYVVIEVGLGGLLDGTNVMTRADKICILTAIGLDHTKILGDTLPEISAQKAGIILPGNSVFTMRQPAEVMDVFAATATRMSATLHAISDAPNDFEPALPLFQRSNLWLAVAAIRCALERANKELTRHMIDAASQAYIPARMETMRYKAHDIIVDGAHNAQKLQTLLTSIRVQYPGRPIAAVVAFVNGDEQRLNNALAVLLQGVDSLILTTFKIEQTVPKQSVDPDVIVGYCRKHAFERFEVIPDPSAALNRLTGYDDHTLLITGSFYLLNDIRPLMNHR